MCVIQVHASLSVWIIHNEGAYFSLPAYHGLQYSVLLRMLIHGFH